MSLDKQHEQMKDQIEDRIQDLVQEAAPVRRAKKEKPKPNTHNFQVYLIQIELDTLFFYLIIFFV